MKRWFCRCVKQGAVIGKLGNSGNSDGQRAYGQTKIARHFSGGVEYALSLRPGGTLEIIRENIRASLRDANR